MFESLSVHLGVPSQGIQFVFRNYTLKEYAVLGEILDGWLWLQDIRKPGTKSAGSGLVLFKLRVGVCLIRLGIYEIVYEISVYKNSPIPSYPFYSHTNFSQKPVCTSPNICVITRPVKVNPLIYEIIVAEINGLKYFKADATLFTSGVR